MSRFCPIVGRNVIYQFCEDCDDKPCIKGETVEGRKDIAANDNEAVNTANKRSDTRH